MRMRLPGSQGEGPQEKPTLQTPRSRTSGLQSCEEIIPAAQVPGSVALCGGGPSEQTHRPYVSNSFPQHPFLQVNRTCFSSVIFPDAWTEGVLPPLLAKASLNRTLFLMAGPDDNYRTLWVQPLPGRRGGHSQPPLLDFSPPSSPLIPGASNTWGHSSCPDLLPLG